MQGLRTCIYKVPDIQEATEWYMRAFSCQPYFQEPYYVGFNIEGYELGLQPQQASEKIKGESVIAYWGVDNIEDSYGKLLALGATEHEKPTNVGGELMTATVIDPYGNIIGLIYNPNFKPEG